MTSAGIRWTSRLLFMVACVYARDVSAQGGTAPAPSVPEAEIRTPKPLRPFDAAPTLPLGISDSPGTPVVPQSLYLAQLAERLGPQAFKNIGY